MTPPKTVLIFNPEMTLNPMERKRRERMNVDELLELARKKKTESEKAAKQRRVDELAAEYDELKRKLRSAEVQNDTYIKERLATQKKLGEMKGLEQFIDPGDYEAAEESLLDDLNKAEDKLQVQKSLIDGLSQRMSVLSVEMTSVRQGVPAGEEPLDAYMAAALDKSRDEVKKIYEDVLGLRNLLAGCNKDLRLVNCNCRIASGNLRLMQIEMSPDPSIAEQLVFRRAFGMIGTLTKEYMCGRISALSKEVSEDWRQYVAQARIERDRILSATSELKRTNSDSATVRPEKESGRLEKKFNIPEDLLSRTTGIKMSFFGGEKIAVLANFAEDALKAKKVNWYESVAGDYKSLMSSISCGGPDVIVMMNAWVSHGHSGPIMEACKLRGIPVVQLNSSSKDVLVEGLTNVLKRREKVA